jgi:gliding motility-associated-like protein
MKKHLILCLIIFGLFFTRSSKGQSIASITCLEVQGSSVSISWSTTPNPITFVTNHIFATDISGGISEIAQSTNLSGTYLYSNVDANTTSVCVYLSTEDNVSGAPNFTTSETFCSTFLTASPSVSPPGFVNLQWNSPSNNATWLAAVNAEVWLEYPAGVWSSVANLPGSSTSYDHEVTTCGDELNFQIRYSGLPNCDFASNIAGDFFYDQTAPPIPSFTRVTVNSITNQATMDWNPFPVGDTDGYLIYACNGTTVTLLDTAFVGINSSVFSDMLSTPNAGPECYLIAAIDSCYSGTPPSPNTSPTGSTCNCTIYLSPTTYTLCENSLNFSWTPYTGWDNGVDYYVLMQNDNPDGMGFTPLDTVDGSILQLNYEFTSITPGNNYYSIVAYRNGGNAGYWSISNVQTVNVVYPTPPIFNYITSVSVNNAKTIDINVRSEATPVPHKYILQRKNLYAPYDWQYHQDITLSAANIIFTDTDVNSDDIIYDYRVIVQNPCGYYVDTTNVGKNIRLRGANNSELLLNSLNWSKYEDWENGVQEYEILRSVDGAMETPASSGPSNFLSFQDDLEPFLSSKGQFCYRIQAYSEPISYFPNETFSSYSNKKCLDQEPIIWIPNAMMIHGNNDLFFPVISFADTNQYTMNIFSRWGDYVFETNKLSEKWDGRMNGGDFVHENAYVYYITVKNGIGVLYERRGTITVLKD